MGFSGGNCQQLLLLLLLLLLCGHCLTWTAAKATHSNAMMERLSDSHFPTASAQLWNKDAKAIHVEVTRRKLCHSQIFLMEYYCVMTLAFNSVGLGDHSSWVNGAMLTGWHTILIFTDFICVPSSAAFPINYADKQICRQDNLLK